ELRSTGAQTVIPPSTHPSGEDYLWEGEPWGGDQGPTVIDGKQLAARVAMLGLAAVLIDNWPKRGSRHQAYLALAGGLLRYGDEVHPFWGEQAHAAEQLIRALADATRDEEGADARGKESVLSTIRLIREGKPVQGFPSLAELIGEPHVDQVRLLRAEVEHGATAVSRQALDVAAKSGDDGYPVVVTPEKDKNKSVDTARDEPGSTATDGDSAVEEVKETDPLGARMSTSEPVSIAPYLYGQVSPVEPSVLLREDGQALMYPGRVNMLYGSSESAKSWIALFTSMQVMATGQRAVYLDFEDEPVSTL